MNKRILEKDVPGWNCSFNNFGNFDPGKSVLIIFFILCLFRGSPVQAQHALGVWGHPYIHSSESNHQFTLAHFSLSWQFSSISQKYWAKKWNVKNASMEFGAIIPEKQNGSNWYSNRWYVAGSLDFELWNGRNLSVGLQPVFGIVWLPDQSDEQIADHHLLGSQLNNLFAIASHIDWQVSDQLMISGNIRLNHISNGGRVLPNRGLNYTTAGLGLYYQWYQNLKEAVYMMEPEHRKFSFSIASGLGIKAIKNKPRVQWVNMWQLAMQYRPGYRVGWVLSADYFLTWNSAEEKSSQQNILGEWPGSTLGLAPGIQLHFGKLKLVGQIGSYLWSEKEISESLYQNVEFEYHLVSHWSAIAYMRLHSFDTADCMVFGLRYSLPSRK